MYRGTFLPLLTFMLLLSACSKDELTFPAKVFFEFEMIAHKEGNNLKSGPPFDLPFSTLTINQGALVIESIEFDGRREEGRDVFFISDLKQLVIVDLETGKSNQELSFDIPQGIYNRIDIYLELGGNEEIPLVLEGNIGKGQSDRIPLRFEYNIRDRIKVRAEPGGQANKIVLRKDTPSRARIVLDAGKVFQSVKLPVLQNATVSRLFGEDVILINPYNNNDIFNKLADRLEKSFKVIID